MRCDMVSCTITLRAAEWLSSRVPHLISNFYKKYIKLYDIL